MGDCFFFNDTATTEIYTLSLHDALPICAGHPGPVGRAVPGQRRLLAGADRAPAGLRHTQCLLRLVPRAVRQDRKSTRLNSSHANISYAVFCLKKKNKRHTRPQSSNMTTP